MTRNLVAVVAGGALAFALAGAGGQAVAWGSVHPAGAARATLVKADPSSVLPVLTAEAGHGPTVPPDPW